MDNYENKFKEIKVDVLGNIENVISEEDAKLQIVNRILIESLGWPHANIACENKHENGFSDYIVKESELPSFLVEA